MRTLNLGVLSIVAALAAAAAVPPARAQEVIRVEGAVGIGGDTQMPVFPGMRPRDVKTGTGRIRGRVLSSDSGTPLRRAQVRLSGTDINPHSANTDGEGRFDFRDLPPGRFMLSATKSGYVTVQYGQTRAFEGGKPIELLTGQLIDKADLLVPRG